ncbi:hypothetical protein GIB67_027581 [Kingdonia uniflora]|uniref:Kinesin-like protein n=1 Tax=Kingdonia uniflora TaxID=39325 RepID=A0A7J7NL36_9MAGN|nr:hypothetical protein GIB67_027581 [Kingdonia uniflora]
MCISTALDCNGLQMMILPMGTSFLELDQMQNPLKLLIEQQPWRINDIGVPHPTHFHPQTDEGIWNGKQRLSGRVNSESFKFDEVVTENASQRRVHDGVAKPVMEGVLNGYNGTVMAYDQIGTGKTYTVGQLGKDDISQRGMMVRAMEDILKNTSSTFDTVEFSYLQLYLEHIQELLVPENNNIPIVEDSKTGKVFLPGTEVVKVRDLDHFLKLLQIDEANRHTANTKMNTESSRSHAILMINVRKLTLGKVDNEVSTIESGTKNDLQVDVVVPTLRKSKLLIVDLAGSERIDKSGSKGTARTSLIVTIGPSARHHSETASTIMFGQRAMKIVNMLKLKEEFDYESLCRKLENRVDFLTAEIERQQKLRDDDKEVMEKKIIEYQNSFAGAKKSLSASSELLEKENSRLELEIKNLVDELSDQKYHNDLLRNEMYEKKIEEMIEQLEDERARSRSAREQLAVAKQTLIDHQMSIQVQVQNDIDELAMKLKEMCQFHEKAEKSSVEEKQRKYLEDECAKSKRLASENDSRVPSELSTPTNLLKHHQARESISGQRATIAKIFEEVGPQKVVAMLLSEDFEVQIHALKMVAYLAAEGLNQGKIVEEGGIGALLMLLEPSQNTTIHRVASGAIANLAMSDMNQVLIMSKGGAQLLANIASKSNDPLTLRMVAGAIANLCGNQKLHKMPASRHSWEWLNVEIVMS